VQNSIIENDRFSTEKKAAIIRVVAPCSLVVKKRVKTPKIWEKKAAVQFGSVPPYSLVVIGCAKSLKFGNKKSRRTVW